MKKASDFLYKKMIHFEDGFFFNFQRIQSSKETFPIIMGNSYSLFNISSQFLFFISEMEPT